MYWNKLESKNHYFDTPVAHIYTAEPVIDVTKDMIILYENQNNLTHCK